MTRHEITLKLAEKVIEYSKSNNLLRDGPKCSMLHWFKNTYENTISKDISHSHWLIDGYILLFHNYIEKNVLKTILELSNNDDEDNVLIALTILYKVELNLIKTI